MDWKIKKDALKLNASDDFWYMLNNGYIQPDDILDNGAQIKELHDAIGIVSSFETALEEAELFEEM